MSANSENQINLKTLQRVDSNIIEIIDNTSQVAIYKYEKKLEQWEGTDIEGTLFLYKRCALPFHGFIIVNRLNTTNFIESITSDMQFQLQDPYLLYKNTSDDIIGCWFYEHKDLKRISKKIQTIVLKQASCAGPRRQRCVSESETTALPPREESSSQDIITLLSQAHEKYMKNVSQPKEPKIKNNNTNDKATVIQNPENSLIKSIPTFHISKDAPIPQEVVSPRRRFLSTGSFDSQRASGFHLDRCFGEKSRVQNSENLRNGSGKEKVVPSRLFPIFSHDEVLPVTLEQQIERRDSATNGYQPFGHCRKLLFNNLEPPDWKTSVDRNAHFTSMKQVLKSHMQDNPKLIVEIHEAYISSLRSLFNKV